MFEGLLQPIHLIIILAIILIVFGAGKLPEVGGGLGKSITEFRRGVKDATASDPVAETSTMGTMSSASMNNAVQTCATCGASMPAGARFCANCGAKVTA
ncbi:MAG TPA: twin-arginine translocase TatA/TatE family subunit [Nitrolancea sp.]|jgi:sec-independent protein translocase protein TatA|nr:twin-arginine translocase TatA/TatE family subunit [Nitrolancea sp.]